MEERLPTRRWSREEYDRLIDLGVIGEDEHVQLIDGDIIEMAPQNSPHAGTVTWGQETLQGAFGRPYIVRAQSPLALGPSSEPEPDIAVVVRTPDRYTSAHPTTALLVVEISDSTLAFDRTRKAAVYAAGPIADYWIVNLVDRVVEVYRDPIATPGERQAHAYRTVQIYRPGEQLAPLALPGTAIAVDDLLPPA